MKSSLHLCSMVALSFDIAANASSCMANLSMTLLLTLLLGPKLRTNSYKVEWKGRGIMSFSFYFRTGPLCGTQWLAVLST